MADVEDGPSRPRRQISSKMKKLELLAQMRKTVKSGQKNKYEVGELKSVYEEVDEREYSKRVLERQEEDWIVDDDGCGYVEDGREIFDDDLDDESVEKSKKEKSSKKRSRVTDETSVDHKKGNIRNMLGNMPTKKKKKENIKLDEDNILGDIIGELDGMASSPVSATKITMPKVTKEDEAREYMQSLAAKKVKKAEAEVLKEKSNTSIESPKTFLQSVPEKLFSSRPVAVKKEPEEVKPQVPTQEIVKKEITIKVEDPNISGIDLFDDLDAAELGDIIEQTEDKNTQPETPKVEVKQEPVLSQMAGSAVNSQKTPLLNGHIKPEIKEEDISEEWDGNAASDDPGMNIVIDKSKIPLTKNSKGEDVFRFYYWDAHEEPFSQPGTVFLFGKVYIESAKTFASCCVSVKNIERRIFLLPRERKMNLHTGVETSVPVSMADVYEEFNTSVSSKFKIKSFRSRKTVMKYCFGKEGVPVSSEYLEVRYAANLPAVPKDLRGETFSCVFGTNTPFLELFILGCGLKGPGWLEFASAEPNPAPISWCKVEVTCRKPSDIVKVPGISEIPPLSLVTLIPYVIYNSKLKHSEVVAAAVLINSSYPVDKPPPKRLFNQHYCVLSRPSDTPWPYDFKESLGKFSRTKVERMESERALLSCLLAKIHWLDPDIIIGHDLVGFGIDAVVDRLGALKVPNWSRLGRLRRSNIPQGKAKFQIERTALTGRLLCDIKISAKELIKSRSYDLETLCQNVLRLPEGKRPEINEEIFRYSYSSGPLLLESVWALMKDASYILSIFAELNVLPLACQITCIAGNVMSRTLMGGRSERNEYLLLHAFSAKGYIVPDKEYKKSQRKDEEGEGEAPTGTKSTRKKPTYSGGLVLDPKVGLYDDLILLMDFNSLYPSIIQEYNICFTTIPIASINVDDQFFDDFDSLLPDDTVPQGILPTEIRKLVESRREVKSLLKNPNLNQDLRMQYDIRQMALKLTANSMYGCLGFANSRFFAKPLAAIVTAKGREILMSTKRLVDGHGFDVIYGDTDSLMIDTKTKNLDDVNPIGRKIKTEVNKSYKQVELDIDGIFKKMLLLRKKKYAAITVTKLPNNEIRETKEMKGLDIVRRDWSQLSAEIGKTILDHILSDDSLDDRIENIDSCLRSVREDLTEGKVPLTLLTVTKQLVKAPEDYTDAMNKGLSHVIVALRMNKASAKRFKQGDTVPYVVCLDGTNNSATMRAYHLDELKSSDTLKIDVDYYLSQQIHPVIARLCDPIEGIDAASIAMCLGMDPTQYKQRTRLINEDDDNAETIFGKKDEERFKDCSRFTFVCANEDCKTENVIEGPRRKTEKGEDVFVLERCANPECKVSPMTYLPYIHNQLQIQMRKHIHQYYQRWLICEDPVCGHRTQNPSFVFDGAYPVCNKCNNSVVRREITSLQLYTQLTFFSHIFDLTKLLEKKIKIPPEVLAVYAAFFNQVAEVLKSSKFSVVDLSALFSDMFPVYSR